VGGGPVIGRGVGLGRVNKGRKIVADGISKPADIFQGSGEGWLRKAQIASPRVLV